MSLGLKTIRKLVEGEDALSFHRAKLSQKMFKGDTEKSVFSFVHEHLEKYHTLPQLSTLEGAFPEIKEVKAPEPSKYYLDKLTERFAYDVLNKANIASQDLLKGDQSAVDKAQSLLQAALNEITEQKYRHRILDFGKEGLPLVVQAYYNISSSKNPPASFGWPYMDDMSGGVLSGDVVSFVGRPAAGKSFKMLYVALHNWSTLHLNTMLVSMEMNALSMAQRAAAMYAHTNLTQLKVGGYSSSTYQLFTKNMSKALKEPAKFYVIDGNLAASVEDIYILSSQLKCQLVLIDGAYLLRHKDKRLDRYTRVAENVEAMKKHSTDIEIPTFASWQFSREASKKKQKGHKVGLEDIGYSDAIGQVSSIVLGLMQEDGIETMNTRTIDLLKGRSGEVGQFSVNWKFDTMNFSQVSEGKMELPGEEGLKYL